MAVNWGSIAGQLGGLGLGDLAKEAARHGAEAEAQRRADNQRLSEPARPPAAPAAARTAPATAPAVGATQLRGMLQSLSPAELEILWKHMVTVLDVRAVRGELSAERAVALKQVMAEFDRARALTDLEDRTLEMRRVMASFSASFTTELRT